MDGKPKKITAPFKLAGPSSLSSEGASTSTLQRYSDLAPEEFHLESESKDDLIRELDGLVSKSEQQRAILEERTTKLRLVVKGQFGIEDPERWLSEQAEAKPKVTLSLYPGDSRRPLLILA